MKLVLLAVAVLLLSPLMLKAYINVAPGEIVGSVDGWLGFLGGYTGGLLAFISAIFIFNNQRSETIKPYLDVKTSPKEANSILYDLPSPNLKYINLSTGQTVGLGRHDLFLSITIKNIGLGPCIKLVIKNEKGQRLSHFYTYEQQFLENASLATIEQSSDILFALNLDLNTKSESGVFKTKYIVEYEDINGKSYKQRILIHEMSKERYEVLPS